MKLNRRTLDKLKDEQTTIISKGIQLEGEVKGTHDVILYGEFEGNIELSGVLLVGNTGKISGEIKAKHVVIEGDVVGKMTATGRAEIREGGKYKGDILATSILVSENALLEGNVKMKMEGEKPSVQQFPEKRRSQLDKV